MKIVPPWTPEQVRALNEFQHSGVARNIPLIKGLTARFHPFTCGNDSNHEVLIATPDGWVCNDCEYTQKWAHGFMAMKVVLEDGTIME